MDAWERLIFNSSLEELSADAWEHLQAQEGGEPCNFLILADGLTVELDQTALQVTVEEIQLEVSVEKVEISLELESFE